MVNSVMVAPPHVEGLTRENGISLFRKTTVITRGWKYLLCSGASPPFF
jgi:hypothetical protein